MSRNKLQNENLSFLESELKLDIPKMYKVILHNDHYTTMEFVVMILQTIFHMPEYEATDIMMNVHNTGIGICGTYTKDIAATKVNQVHDLARQNQYPLKCSFEEI
jgi:ATP-dependent Clp protease adaptor protein ClpS